MAFNVSYIFQARDQFSNIANKVKRGTQSLRKKTRELSRELVVTGNKFARNRKKAASLSRELVVTGNKTKKIRKEIVVLGRQLDVVGNKFTLNFKTKAARAIAAAKRKLDGFPDRLKKISKSLGAIGTKFTAIATVPIAFFTASFIKAASNAEETRSKFNTVFSDIRSQADITADNLGKNFGLAGTKARELIGDTGDLLTGFGFTSKTALDLSNKVNELAVDLASFTNFSGGAEGASQALTKALLGERESIKSLGISILEEDVKARVKQLVLVDKMKFATLRQAKAFATLQLAQEQSKNAIGDFNRTSESYANKVRVMQARTQDLRESFGRILLPIAVKVVEALTSLAQKFTDLSPVTQKIILVTAGVVAVLGPLLLVIAAITAAVPFMIAGLVGIGVAITFMTGPIGLVINSIALLSLIVFQNFGAIKLFIVDTIESIVNKFNSLSDAISLAMANAIDFVIGKFEALSNGAASVAKFIGSIFGAEVGKIDAITDDLAAKKIAAENLFKTQGISIINSVASNSELTGKSESKAQIDVNIRAPEGAVESVKTKRKGNASSMDLGVNMQSAA